jgi:hypothetical protein
MGVHFLFIVFVMGGGLFVIQWPKTAWVHLPAAIWGAMVEIFNWVCPLTYIENFFLIRSGKSTYEGDFIGQYLIPVIYPEGLTVEIQHVLGGVVILVNIIFYTFAILKNKENTL